MFSSGEELTSALWKDSGELLANHVEVLGSDTDYFDALMDTVSFSNIQKVISAMSE